MDVTPYTYPDGTDRFDIDCDEEEMALMVAALKSEKERCGSSLYDGILAELQGD